MKDIIFEQISNTPSQLKKVKIFYAKPLKLDRLNQKGRKNRKNVQRASLSSREDSVIFSSDFLNQNLYFFGIFVNLRFSNLFFNQKY